ncbi:MAG: hypothetical protein ACTTH5_00120 [Wolinella sp.]
MKKSALASGELYGSIPKSLIALVRSFFFGLKSGSVFFICDSCSLLKEIRSPQAQEKPLLAKSSSWEHSRILPQAGQGVEQFLSVKVITSLFCKLYKKERKMTSSVILALRVCKNGFRFCFIRGAVKVKN